MSKESKTLRCYLVVNWRDGDIRSRKTEPEGTEKSPFEFTIPVKIRVNIPESPTIEVSEEFELPQTTANAAADVERVEYTDRGDWKAVAEEALEKCAKLSLKPVRETHQEATIDILTECEEMDLYPSPKDVRAYVARRYADVYEEVNDD